MLYRPAWEIKEVRDKGGSWLNGRQAKGRWINSEAVSIREHGRAECCLLSLFVKYNLPKFNRHILEWSLFCSGAHWFLQLPFEKSGVLSTIGFISLLLFASVPSKQFFGSSMNLPASFTLGNHFHLKLGAMNHSLANSLLLHTGQSGAGGGGHSFLLYPWTLSFSQSLQNQHTDLDLWKLLYWRITREDFDSPYKANSDYVYLSVIFLS